MLKNGTIILRPLIANDLPYMHRWYQDREVSNHLVSAIVERSEGEALAYMQNWLSANERVQRFAIVAKHQLIGQISLKNIDSNSGTCELHIFIGPRETRGQGLGTQATRLAVSYAFDELHLGQIDVEVLADNVRAIALYKSLGFRATGIREKSALKTGAWKDVVLMTLLKHEFTLR